MSLATTPPTTFISSNVTTVFKSRMRWAGHVVRMGKTGNIHRILVRALQERDHKDYVDIDRRRILNGFR
jgi:hypothetical protein